MMIIPPKLKKGDGVRVISPSHSLKIIDKELRQLADQRFADMGLVLSLGKHAEETDQFGSSSIVSRVQDLHDAFSDPSVKMIITTIGGFNSNQLLPFIDFELIRKNPKIVCGYSDITALSNALYAKTGLVTYSGPHYSSFGEKNGFEFTAEQFEKCLWQASPFEVTPAKKWSNDRWYADQAARDFVNNDGYWIINPGEASGTLLGGNLCTFNLLQGTEYMPDLKNSILFIEDDSMTNPALFDRDLESITQLSGFSEVKGIVIGRFERASGVSRDILTAIIKNKKAFSEIPVIANADFGHTEPKITFPIGGTCTLSASDSAVTIQIVQH